MEIGPGRGALTGSLVDSGARLDAIELDRDLTAGLLAAYSLKPGFALHSADALSFDYDALVEQQQSLRVVGNLPYNISTPLLFKLLEHSGVIQDMHFMLQRELVLRLAAQPGGKEWGRLGIMAQYHCEVDHLFDVPPTAFDPPPRCNRRLSGSGHTGGHPGPPVRCPHCAGWYRPPSPSDAKPCATT